QSSAPNLVAGQVDSTGPFTSDVFLFDRSTGTATLVSHAVGAPTVTGDGDSYALAMSTDGGLVAFQSAATNLVSGQVDSAGTYDMFLFERATGITRLVSRVAGTTTTASGLSVYVGSQMLSADGTVVVFGSTASTLVADDLNEAQDLFAFVHTPEVVTAA